MELQEIQFDRLQEIVKTVNLRLVDVLCIGGKVTVLLLSYRSNELRDELKVPLIYERKKAALRLNAIKVVSATGWISRIPIEFEYPSIAEIGFDNERLRISTCDGGGYVDIFVHQPRFQWVDYDRFVGYVLEERCGMLYYDNIVVDRDYIFEIIRHSSE